MARPSEDDRAAIDRAFAELVAGYHLTADRPDPLPPASREEDPAVEEARVISEQQTFRFVEAPPEPAPAEEPPERYVPDPLPPLRPALPTVVGWAGIGFALVVVLTTIIGLNLPAWTGWLAVGAFIGGFGLLVSRLPRHRPPDAGSGAVV